ncbi:MAG TPA: FAD-binding oxidoreductase [Arenicellales bacterium]|nr:FAD-binding oxidoreductase [Arenicellales bacterium]
MLIDGHNAAIPLHEPRDPAAARNMPVLADLGSREEPALMQVTTTRRLSQRLLQLGLRRADGRAFAFRPGQFCRIAVPTGDGSVWRSYSIATPALEGGSSEICEVAITAMEGGLATEYLFGLAPGECVRMSGPFGRLVLPDTDPAHYLLIGTGTGMAPYRAMLPELEKRTRAASGRLNVTLLMGVRAPSEALYIEDFLEFVAHAPDRRQLLVSYSRQLPEVPEWFETAGHVQSQLAGLRLSSSEARVMLCGNPEMIDDCSAALAERGFDTKTLVREKYLAGPRPR